jgi:fermentation-respiration switch protein FrsA (DUF1100 family)
LILESPFTSIASVARSHFPYNLFPVSLLLVDKFDNATKIKRVDSPLLITHGTEDTIVDKNESNKLFEQANMPKELYFIEGADHNNIQYYNPEKYWSRIAEWMEALK